jgi:hypothetical protein
MFMETGVQNTVMEWSFFAAKRHDDPFNEVEFAAVFTDSHGGKKTVPGFWAGENEWCVRFASPDVGVYQFETVSSDTSDGGLHSKHGRFEVGAYQGENPLLRHGAMEVAPDKRHFQYHDGTPFFWLADTWWMGLVKRLSWPEDFQTLLMDRVDKGFTVIQIVAGLYPDMDQFDERGANEAGYPWEKDFKRINPDYFARADKRIARLVEGGLVPCIFGCWGYYLKYMGLDKMKKHWRYLVARYGAYPVVWGLAGEATMPFYLSPTKETDGEDQRKGWTEVARYVRQIDAYHRLCTLHPGDPPYGRYQVTDPTLVDFDMMQTGHSSHLSFPNTIKCLRTSRASEPTMPTLIGEACYEGIIEANREEIQRLVFWCCMLAGAAGHTYGANGIWQVNTREKPYGPSPHGTAWGDTSWEDAARLPGSGQLGVGKRILERYPWWQFEPHQEWVEPLVEFPESLAHRSGSNLLVPRKVLPGVENPEYFMPYAAGIPGKVRVFYSQDQSRNYKVTAFEKGVTYQASFINPSTGKVIPIGKVTPDKNGDWYLPTLPVFRDWVVVMEA